MNKLLCVFSVLFALVLSGCEAVFTQQPLGDEAVTLDPATWQGTWLSDEIVLLTTVLDSEKGQLQAAWIERGAEGARFEVVAGYVRQTGDMVYLTMRHEPAEIAESGEPMPADSGQDAAGEPEYFWARIVNDGRRAILWWPDVEQIRLAVGEKRLPGRIKQDQDVVLGQLEAEELRMIDSPASNLLQWSQPVTFVRVGD